MVKQGNDVIYNKIEQGLNGIPSDYYRQEACEIRICKVFGISNDRGEYIMSHGTMRANQHAGKGVSGTWLPMRAFERVCGRGLK